MNVRRACAAVALCIVIACSSPAVTITLRTGQALTGEVTSITDEQVTVKTPGGTQTLAWRHLSNDSIKELNPDLYERLLAAARDRARQFEEEQTAKGLIKLGGKWLTSNQANRIIYRFVRLRVITTEKGPSWDTVWRSNVSAVREAERECWGIIDVTLEGAATTNSHTLRVEGSHYLSYDSSAMSTSTRNLRSVTNSFDKEFQLSGQATYELQVETPKYTQRRYSYSANVYSGRRRYTWGYESEGFDVNVWLDGRLVYQMTKGKTPEYHLVDKF